MSDRKQDILAYLTSTRDELTQMVRSAGPEQTVRTAYVGAWSTREMLAHLATIEPRMSATVRKVLAGEEIAGPADFDIHRWNAKQVESRRTSTVEELLQEMSASRQETLRLVEGLSESDLDKLGRHRAFGEVSVESLLRRIGTHEVEHAKEVLG